MKLFLSLFLATAALLSAQIPTQTYQFRVSDQNGYADINQAYLLITSLAPPAGQPTVAIPGAYFLRYTQATNTVAIASDSGTFGSDVLVGNSLGLSNTQCSVSSVLVSTAGTNSLLFKVLYNFNQPGTKFIQSQVVQNTIFPVGSVQQGQRNSGWKSLGTVTVDPAPVNFAASLLSTATQGTVQQAQLPTNTSTFSIVQNQAVQQTVVLPTVTYSGTPLASSQQIQPFTQFTAPYITNPQFNFASPGNIMPRSLSFPGTFIAQDDSPLNQFGTVTSNDIAFNSAIKTAAALLNPINNNVPFVDTYPGGIGSNNILFGNATVAVPTANTNDVLKSITDAGHPTYNGHSFISGWLTAIIKSLIGVN